MWRCCGSAVLLAGAMSCLSYGAKLPWKGYAILGNGQMTAVYSDDARISAANKRQGIQHFYFGDYTADYVLSTGFEVVDEGGRAIEATGEDVVGMKNFFTTETQTQLRSGATERAQCFIHPEGAAVLSLETEGVKRGGRYRFQTMLQRETKTDQVMRLTSLREEHGMAVAVWSNGTALAVAPKSAQDRVRIGGETVSVSGALGSRVEVLLVPARSAAKAVEKAQSLRKQSDLEEAAGAYWNKWMDGGVTPAFRDAGADAAKYLEAYKRN